MVLLDISGAFKPRTALSGGFRELSKVGGGQLMEKPSRSVSFQHLDVIILAMLVPVGELTTTFTVLLDVSFRPLPINMQILFDYYRICF